MTYTETPRKEFGDLLKERFPVLYEDMYGPRDKTCMAFGIECQSGWYDIIWELSEKLEPLAKKIKGEFPAKVEQVKEKFGTLRFYISSVTDEDDKEVINEMYKHIGEYELKTVTTCEVCGEKGELRKEGWYRTLCDKHHEERQKERQSFNDRLGQ